MRFLIDTFISINIIECVSTQSSPGIRSQAFIVNHDINLQPISKLREVVDSLVLEFSKLDTQKNDAKSPYKLGFLEFSRRGDLIEHNLQKELGHINKPTIYSPPILDAQSIVTKLFTV